ncbi:MAG: hypothetical protein KBT47_04290, partial [Armatimonadetes bacterium]|nr:hypothetical protein [Candidatus Hippobium faecium]
MKKFAFILLVLIIAAGGLFAAQDGFNLLWDQPFVIKTTDAYGDLHFAYNTHWKGFFDTDSASHDNSKHFLREIIPLGYNSYNVFTYFSRNYTFRNNEEVVSISTNPYENDYIVAEINPYQTYEVGFSMKANNVYFDHHICRYGFTVKVDWYDQSCQYISSSVQRANLDSSLIAKTGVASATTGNEWLRYRNKVIAPAGAKYFTYYILADKGVYTDFNDKVFIEEPVFVVNNDKIMGLCFRNSLDSGYELYNNYFRNNQNTAVRVLAFYNSKAYAIPDSDRFARFYLYPASKPDQKKVYTCETSSIGSDIMNYYFDFVPEDLENGKYIIDAELIQKSVNSVYAKDTISFFITDESKYELGSGYAGSGNVGSKWLRIDGRPTFMLGLVDRGVNYGGTKMDTQQRIMGYNRAAGTEYGADDIGSNKGIRELAVSETNPSYLEYSNFMDYLNLIAPNESGKEYFSFTDFRKWGINAVYPAYISRLPFLYKGYDILTSVYGLGEEQADLNIFYPLQEFNRNNLTRDIQFRMLLEKDLLGDNIFGADNVFNTMAQTVPGINNIAAYMIGEDVNTANLDEIETRKNQMQKFDDTKPVAITVSLDDVTDDGTLTYGDDLGKYANIVFLNVEPSGNDKEWVGYKLDKKIEKLTKILNKKNLNCSVFVNFSLKDYIPIWFGLSGADSDSDISADDNCMPISEIIKIYRLVKESPNGGGLFFDNIGSMTASTDGDADEPLFHYNLFRLFLKEKDYNTFLTDNIESDMMKYICDNFTLNGKSLNTAVNEIHYNSKMNGDKETIETVFYYNNTKQEISSIPTYNSVNLQFNISKDMY